MNDETLCLTGHASPDGFDSLSVPVYRASTIVFPSVEAYQARRGAIYDGYSYGLYGTPTSRALEQLIAALENGTHALTLPSGFAAISLVTLSSVKSGERVLFPDNCYDTIRPFAETLLRGCGIIADYYDPAIGGEIASLLDERTKLVWVESPGSVTLEVQDTPAIASAAHARGVLVASDNAWATPLRFRPLDHGCDFSICPLSKYLSGHSDVVMGSVTVRDPELYHRLKDYSRYLGLGVSADEASLALRGIETLAVRLDRSEASGLDLARWLKERPSVKEVRHPALPDSPGHELWLRDFTGSSSLFSVFLDEAVRPVLHAAVESLQLFSIGASWGGTRSVIAVFERLPTRTCSPVGHDGPVIRLSIGIEHVEDLKADLVRLMDRLDNLLASEQVLAMKETK